MKNSEFENERVRPSIKLQFFPLEKASGGTCNAYSTRLFGKKVFVKEMKPEFAGDARMLAAFRKEAEIGFRLDHPNLPKYIFAEGVLPSDKYIVQEFIDGQTLTEFIKGNSSYFQNRKNVERFIRELSDVIDYLHRNQIVHLDLKPGNILISRVGCCLKLVDLGFCASDYYDDTRGLTPGEFAPEGCIKPEERGSASDYYGVGKILNYIRTNTPHFPQKVFQKLEEGLLNPDPAKRLSSKEEIEKAITKNGRQGRLWLATTFTIIVSAAILLLIFVSVADNHDVPSDEIVEQQGNSPAVKDTETSSIEKAINSIEPIAVIAPPESQRELHHTLQTRDGNIPAQKQETYAPSQSEFSYESYERLKAEMKENINKNFADFEKMINAYLRDGKFTDIDYKTVSSTYNVALHKTFETGPYKAKYKDLSPSLIDDTMAEIMMELEKMSWGGAYKKYIKQYQAFTEGSSR